MKIYIFNTEEEAYRCLHQINTRGLALFEAAGYEIKNDWVYRAGEDKPIIKSWGKIEASPDGRYWFPSLKGRWAEHEAALLEGLQVEEIDLPSDEWLF